MKFLVAIVIALVAVDVADACNCRGRYRRACSSSCSYYRPYYKPAAQVIYKQQPVYYPQQILNIANVYPQGQTQYASVNQPYASVSQASALYATNPTLLAQLAAAGRDNDQQNFNLAVRLAESMNASVAEVAKIQAATEHLRLAVSSGSGGQAQSSVQLKITQGSNGIQVEKVTEGTVTKPPTQQLPATSGDPPAAFTSICLKCHSGATPKGKLSLDVDSFDCKTITKSLRMIADGKMPPPDSGIELTQQQKGEIMRYFLDHETPEPSPLPAAELPPPPPENQ